MLRGLKSLLEVATGTRIYRRAGVPRGADLACDLDRICGCGNVATVFDVGAHNGETSLRFARDFRNARIHAFEPVEDNYQSMCSSVAGQPRILAHRLALGESVERRDIQLCGDNSTGNSFLSQQPGGRTQQVDVTTIEQFCSQQVIDAIDFLKIDTEGFELPVLRGARPLLETGRIGLIQLELEMRKSPRHFTPFEAIDECLAQHGYHLIALFDQQRNWIGGQQLMFANALYGSETVVTQGRLPSAVSAEKSPRSARAASLTGQSNVECVRG